MLGNARAPDPAAATLAAPAAVAPAWRGDAALAAAVGAAVAAGVRLRFLGEELGGRDTLRLYGPLRGLVEEALRTFRLPLWNPYEGTGRPLLAEGLHGVLHPVSVAAAWIAPGSLDALLLAYLACAAAGAVVLARALGGSRPAAALAGVGFGLSGFVASMTDNLVFLAGSASLPWLVAALRANAAPGRAPLVAAAVAAACALFAGDAQTTVVGALLGLALAAEAGGVQAALRAALGLALGALVAAVQLVPTAAHLGRTVRSLGLEDVDRVRWALSPWRLVELFSPGLLDADHGVLEVPLFAALDPESGYRIPFADSVHVGVPVLALAVQGLRAGRRARVLAAAAALLVWLALGHHAGARQLLGGVPIWGAFRYAEKLVGPLTLALVLLAALGLDRLGASPPGRVAAAAPLAVAGAWVLAVALPDVLAAPLQWTGHAAAATAFCEAAQQGLVFVLAGAAAVAVVGSPRVSAPVRAWAGVAAVALGGLAALPWAIHPPPRACPGAGALAELRPAPIRIATPNYHEHAAGPGDFEDSWCDLVEMGVPSTNVAARLAQIDVYSGLDTIRFLKVFTALGDDRWRTFRRFSVSHVVVDPPVDGAEGHVVGRAIDGGTRRPSPPGRVWSVWEVPHRPWASFAPRTSAVPDPQGTLDRLVALVAAGSDEVVLQADRPLPAAPGLVHGVRRTAESLVVDAEASGPAVLVVNDAFWPGWVARLDGVPVPILPADVLVRAVPFPPGRHGLEMEYAPPEVAWGRGLSLLGLAALVAVGLAGRRRAEAGPGREAAGG